MTARDKEEKAPSSIAPDDEHRLRALEESSNDDSETDTDEGTKTGRHGERARQGFQSPRT